MSVYFDYAAATPIDPEVLKAMRPYMNDAFYNPSAQYLAAKKVRSDLDAARVRVATTLAARTGEILFTAGGTEANNLAIKGVMDKYPEGNVIISAIEHESVLEPAKRYNYKIAPVNSWGVVDLGELVKLIDDKTVLVSVMYANNEVGSVQPLASITKRMLDIRHKRVLAGSRFPLYFHTDACQAGNYLRLKVNDFGIDLMTLNGGKLYGPKQSGALFVKTGIALSPLLDGGGQESGLRSGTENVPGCIGFSKALEAAAGSREDESDRLAELQMYFFNELADQLPAAIINGPLAGRLPNNLHLTFPGQDNERLMMELDERGIQCATGSACSAAKGLPSHVLAAMGMADEDARGSLRFTMGRQTTKDDIDELLAALGELIK